MTKLSVDVAVIGAGTAGLGAFHAARKAGKRALLIEDGVFGTTCARVGCMPSKLLIAAAEAAHHARKASGFGIKVGNVQVDGRAVLTRVKAERDRFVRLIVEDMGDFPPQSVLRGRASFVSDTVLRVVRASTQTPAQVGVIPDEALVRLDGIVEVTAAAIVVATGSSPVMPDVFKPIASKVVTSDTLFDWETLPRRVAVFGPGVIGLELGQALSRLGVQVTVFGKDDGLAGLSDPSVVAAATQILSDEFPLVLNADIAQTRLDGDEVCVGYSAQSGESVDARFDVALVATGRAPNLKALALENTTLELDDKGTPRFDRRSMQCGRSSIFIAGDVDADVPFLHEASDEGRIAGGNAAMWPETCHWKRRDPLSIVFTDPQIATVGKRYSALQDTKIAIGCVSFDDQGRARVMRQNRGLLRVYAACGSGQLLGAEMIGPGVEHLSHLVAWAVQRKLTVAEVLDLPFYHPVLEEGLRTALRDAVAALKVQRLNDSSASDPEQ